MFVSINQILTPLGLFNPSLTALTQDAALFNCLLFQPGEDIDYGDDYIRIANGDRAYAQLSLDYPTILILPKRNSLFHKLSKSILESYHSLPQDRPKAF